MIYFQRLMMYLINKKLKLLDKQIILKKFEDKRKNINHNETIFIVVIMIIMVKILIILN